MLGVVTVWSGLEPFFRAHAVGGGLVLGKELASAADGAIAGDHARLAPYPGGATELAPLAADAPTYLDGYPVPHAIRVVIPCYVRTGRTLFAVVRDVRPFLEETWRPALAAAIESEDCVLAVGPRVLTGRIAVDIARARGGTMAKFDASGEVRLADQLEAGVPRTLIVTNPRSLREDDLETLETYLETDLCIVTRARDARELEPIPQRLRGRIAMRHIAMPSNTYIDLAYGVHERARAIAPEVRIHPSVVEAMSWRVRQTDDTRAYILFEQRLRAFTARRHERIMRATDLLPDGERADVPGRPPRH